MFRLVRGLAPRVALVWMIAGVLWAPLTASAANKYWDTVTGVGGGLQSGNGTWNTSTNIWSTAATGTALTTWANNDDAFFQTGGSQTVTLSGTIQANSVTQTVSGTTTTLTGGTALQLQTNAGVVNSGDQLLTINSAVTLNSADVTFNAGSGGGDITVGGAIGQTGSTRGITKSGNGTLILSGGSNYQGATAVTAGVLNIRNNTATGTTAGGVTVSSGAALELQSTITVGAEALSITGTGIGSNGALRNISGSNSWGGTVTLTGAATVQSDAGTITFGAGNSFTGSGQNLTIQGAGNGAINGTITTGAGTLTKNGTGAWTLSGNNTFTGGVTINEGTITLGNGGALNSTTPNAVAFGSNSNTKTLSVNSNSVTVSGLTTGGTVGTTTVQNNGGSNATLTVNNSSANTYGGVLADGAGAGTLALAKNNTGALTLSGNNTFTGGVSITNGEIILGNAGALNSTTPNAVSFSSNSNTKSLTLNGNSVTLSSLTTGATVGTTTVQNNLAGTATLTLNNAGANTYGGVLANGAAGTLAFSKSGAGTLTLSGSNTYSGGTTISAGQITIGNSNALGTGGLSMSGGTLELNDFNISVANLSGTGGTIQQSNGNNTFTVTAGSDNTNTTFGGVFDDANGNRRAALTKTGTGVLTLTGNNAATSSALTTINGGVLRLNNSGALSTGNLTINGGVLELQNPTSLTRAVGTGGNQVQLTGGTSGFSAFGSTATINFSNNGSTVTWGGATFNPSTLVLNESTATAALNFQNALNLGGSTRTINVNANTATLNGVVSNGGLTKGGSGTLALAAANTYTGATTVSDGTLELDSTGSMGNTAISVASGAKIALQPGSGANSAGTTGAGSAGATLTLNAGSTLDMTDNAVGTFNLNQQNSFVGNAFTIGAASGTPPTMTFEIGNAATGPDRINVTKAVNVLATGGIIAITPLSGATSLTSGNYTLMTAASGLGVSGLSLSSPTIVVGGKTYNLSLANSTSTTEILSVTVPTPATAYWSGAASGSWNTINAGDVTNWRTAATGNVDTAQVPGSTTDVFFNTTAPVAGNLSTTLGADFSIKSLTFTSAASSSVSIGGGNTLTIGSAGISVQSGSGAHTIGSGVALGGAQAWTNNSSNVFTVSGNISNGANTLTIDGSGNTTLSGILGNGAGGLTKNGAGTLVISGNNSYTGATAINTGVVNIQHANALGTTAGDTTVASGAALEIQGTTAVGNESLSIAGTGVSNNGALRNVSGSNTYGGTVTLSGAAKIKSDAGTLTMNASNAVTGSNQNLTVDGSGNTVISGTVTTGSGTVTKTGSGKLTMSGANSYTGKTSVSGGGTLSINTIANVGGGNSAVGAPTTSGNGTIDLDGTLEYTGSGSTTDRIVNMTGASTLDASGSGTLALTAASANATIVTGASSQNLFLTGSGSGEINGRIDANANSVTKNGTGTWVLNGNNTYNGVTNINSGTLVVKHQNALGTPAGGTVIASGATLEIQGGVTIDPEQVSIAGSGVGGNGALRNTSGANTKSGTLTLTGATQFQSDSGSLTLSASNAVTGTNQNLSLTGAANGTISGTITTGSGTLTKNGAGTWTLAGANSYTGKTTINGGALSINSIANVGSGNSALGAPTTTVNGTIDLSGMLTYTGTGHTTDRVINLTGTGSLNASGSGALTVAGANSSTPVIVGNMEDLIVLGTGSGRIDSRIDSTVDTVTKSGTGNWWLAGNNTYSGATSVNQGTLRLRHNNAAGTTAGGVDVQNGATLEVDGGITVGNEALTIRGTGVSSSGALRNVSGNNYWGGAITIEGSTGITVVNAGETLTFQGAIGENLPGALLKSGSGTLAITQASTYTGGTTVSAGILKVNNGSGSATGSGNVVVNSSGMLAGSGNIDGLVTITSGGVISPGNSPGTIGIDDVAWDGGGKYLWEINDATGTMGSNPGWDLLNVANTLAITATPSNKFTVLVTSYAGSAANFNPLITQSWQIAAANTITGFNAAAFNLSLSGDMSVTGSTGFTNFILGYFSISMVGSNSIVLTYNTYSTFGAVPEPSTLVMGLGGLAIAAVVRRRRRRQLSQ